MATFVLLHGGWSGGWVWNEVARILRRAGHEVATPTLTGYGERAHLLRQDVTFTTLVDDVLGVLHYGEFTDVVLVAHSLNGPLGQAVAAHAPQQLARLVLLDAVMIEDGQRTVDAFDSAFTAGIQAWVDAAGQGWFVPRIEPEAGSIDDREARGRHTAMPWLPYLEPVALPPVTLPRTFVLCTEKSGSPEDTAILAAARRAREAGWAVQDLASGHVLMWTAPAALAELLEAQVTST